jgi:mannose-6-phosphate isomerase-like protein (cupin superfamily)
MTPSFSEFENDARGRGFDEVLERRWDADSVIPTHSHPFDASALVVQGEMWLTVGDQTQHLRAGDTFALSRGIAHDERYGSEGATYWVARRG